MPNLKRTWEQLAAETEAGGSGTGHREFLDGAQEVADISLPALRPNGEAITTQPYSSLPGKAVRGLASRLTRTLFPATTEWYDYVLTAEIDSAIGQLEGEVEIEVRAQVKDLFAQRRSLVTKFIAHRKVKAKITSLIRRLLVEGQVGMQVLKDRVRTFPLRSIVVKRHSGDLLYWIIKEARLQTARDLDNEELGPDSFVYTMVDVFNKEVTQQVNDGTPEDMSGNDGGDVRQYLLPVGEFPENEDYVYGFAWHFKGLLNEIDNLAASLGEATANASWAVLLVAAIAGVTPEEIRNQWRTGHVVIANIEHFNWLTSGVKLSDWQFIGAVLNDLRKDLREIFLDEEPQLTPDVTATAVLRRIERIDAQTADLLVALETTLQHPLVVATEVAIGLEPIQLASGDDPIQIEITTGTSALQQDMRSMRALQKLGLAKELDPNLGIDGGKLLEEIGRGDGFNYKRVIARVDQRQLVLQNGQPGEGANPVGALPGTSRSTEGGPQPTLEPGAEEARQDQRIPPAAA